MERFGIELSKNEKEKGFFSIKFFLKKKNENLSKILIPIF